MTENLTQQRTAADVLLLRGIRLHIEPGCQGTADDSVSRTVMMLANGVVMTAEQLRTAGIVLGVLAAILFVLGQSRLGVVAAILAG